MKNNFTVLLLFLYFIEKESFPPQKKFFVLINPKSGKGKSLELFKSTIEPIFKDAKIKYDTLITGNFKTIIY